MKGSSNFSYNFFIEISKILNSGQGYKHRVKDFAILDTIDVMLQIIVITV